jgi:hypothetical protein
VSTVAILAAKIGSFRMQAHSATQALTSIPFTADELEILEDLFADYTAKQPARRERLAAMAMQGLCTRKFDGEPSEQSIACWAVAQADALVTELGKPVGPSRLEQLVAAVNALLPDVESEIEQRKYGGNDEDWKPLQQLVDNVKELL